MKKKSTLKKLILGAVLALSITTLKAQTGAALNIGGNSDYVAYPNNAVFNVSKFTIETWVKWTSTGTAVEFITSKGANLMEIHTGGTSNNIRFIPTTDVYLDGGLNTIPSNTWVHIACVYDPSIALAKMYVNGVNVPLTSVGPNPITTAVGSNALNPHIGARPGEGYFFNGSIDEFRIWNTARTQCEINTFMNCEIPTTAPGLILNYHFNQGIAAGTNTSVSTLTDFSGNTINGTLISVALTGSTSNWVAPGGVVSGFTTPLALPNYTSSGLAVCQGNTVSLTGVGATTNTWSGGISNGVAFTPSATGAYNYSGANSVTTCSNTAIANVTVNPLPTVIASTNSSLLCTGQSATLTASGASSYIWNTSATTTLIAVSPSVNTTYTVSGTGANGCINMAMITQSVSPCTGLQANNMSVSNIISVYPNPSNGIYTVNVADKTTITILDVLGKIIYQSTIIDNTVINLQHLPNGLYILKANNNGIFNSIRLIKE